MPEPELAGTLNLSEENEQQKKIDNAEKNEFSEVSKSEEPVKSVISKNTDEISSENKELENSHISQALKATKASLSSQGPTFGSREAEEEYSGSWDLQSQSQASFSSHFTARKKVLEGVKHFIGARTIGKINWRRVSAQKVDVFVYAAGRHFCQAMLYDYRQARNEEELSFTQVCQVPYFVKNPQYAFDKSDEGIIKKSNFLRRYQNILFYMKKHRLFYLANGPVQPQPGMAFFLDTDTTPITPDFMGVIYKTHQYLITSVVIAFQIGEIWEVKKIDVGENQKIRGLNILGYGDAW